MDENILLRFRRYENGYFENALVLMGPKSKTISADTLTGGTEPRCHTDWLEGTSFLKLPETNWAKFEVEDRGEEAEVLI